jgi:hypothetical protein
MPRALAWKTAAATSALLLVGCTPKVGPLCIEPPDGGGDATMPAATTGTYLVTGSVHCTDAGTDAPTNSVGEGGIGDGGVVVGNVLIADQLNNRVVIVDREGNVVWFFGDGSQVPGLTSVVAPNDAILLPGTNEVLIAGTGGPEPGCPDGGCPDNRVIIVGYDSRVITGGYDPSRPNSGGPLSGPTSARLVPTPTGAHLLITDQGNRRVLEVDRATSRRVWQFPAADGGACDAAPPDAGLANFWPQTAERLDNGNTLIADQDDNEVLEVTPCGGVAWSYGPAQGAGLMLPSGASRLDGGVTLIVDSNNERIIEVTGDNPPTVTWTLSTPGIQPSAAVRLANNQHTLVTEITENQVLEYDHGTPPNVVYSHGRQGVAGSDLSGLLDMPYNAHVVDDFTGLTSPFLADSGVGPVVDAGRKRTGDGGAP